MTNRLLVAAVAAFGLVWASGAQARCEPGQNLSVLWKGQWFPATAMKSNGADCFITYKGYDSSWDEWVGPDRIRPRG